MMTYKLPISQLHIVLYNQNWYQIDAMTWHVKVINRNASNISSIFMNINKDIRNKMKTYRKMII